MKTGILELMSWRRFFPALIPKIEKNESNMVLIKVTVKKTFLIGETWKIKLKTKTHKYVNDNGFEKYKSHSTKGD